jgi:hypothetical protein
MLPKQPLRLIFAFEEGRDNDEAVLLTARRKFVVALDWKLHFYCPSGTDV